MNYLESVKVETISIKFKSLEIDVLRLDEVHPLASGNKWFKLKLNIEEARRLNKNILVSMGGAYSNHVLALAALGKAEGFQTKAFIRGGPFDQPSATLRKAEELGMTFEFVDRETYRSYNGIPPGNSYEYIIPEGGSNGLAVQGCMEIAEYIDDDIDLVALPVGTGGTIAGLVASDLKADLLGFSVLKEGGFLNEKVNNLINEAGLIDNTAFKINDEFHFGGYAKWNEELIDFLNEFYRKTTIPLDPIYTGKMFYGLARMAEEGRLPKKVLAIHTGGLQGIEGFNERFGHNIDYQ